MQLGTSGEMAVKVESTYHKPCFAMDDGRCLRLLKSFSAYHTLFYQPRSPAQVARSLDRVIADIRKRFDSVDPVESRANVVCVAHSHVLSAFALRWVGRPLEEGTRLLLDTAGVAVLRCVSKARPDNTVYDRAGKKKADD